MGPSETELPRSAADSPRWVAVVVIAELALALGGAALMRADGASAEGAAFDAFVALLAMIIISFVVGIQLGRASRYVLPLLNALVISGGFWAAIWLVGAGGASATWVGYLVAIGATLVITGLCGHAGYGGGHAAR